MLGCPWSAVPIVAKLCQAQLWCGGRRREYPSNAHQLVSCRAGGGFLVLRHCEDRVAPASPVPLRRLCVGVAVAGRLKRLSAAHWQHVLDTKGRRSCAGVGAASTQGAAAGRGPRCGLAPGTDVSACTERMGRRLPSRAVLQSL